MIQSELSDHLVRPVRRAVLPVAGLGTRFLPATKAIPKEMLPVGAKPLIEHAVEEARQAGIDEFILITGRDKQAIEDHFDHHPELSRVLQERGLDHLVRVVQASELPAGKVCFVRQPFPLGLGHALWCARHLIADEPFAVLLPDDLLIGRDSCLADMLAVYRHTGGNLLAVVAIEAHQSRQYGIVGVESADGSPLVVRSLVEKPLPEEAPSRLGIVGRYILQPEIMTELNPHHYGAGNEIQLTDAIAKMLSYQAVYAYTLPSVVERFDCGSQRGWLAANVTLAASDPETRAWLRQFCQRLSS